MKLLLDTHTFLWMNGEPTKLSATASSLIVDPGIGLFLSVARGERSPQGAPLNSLRPMLGK
jgi:hypothetical protein